MLSEILRLASERRVVSVCDLTLALGVDAEALQPMLDLLERKGRLRGVDPPCKGNACAGCAAGRSGAMRLYAFVERGD